MRLTGLDLRRKTHLRTLRMAEFATLRRWQVQIWTRSALFARQNDRRRPFAFQHYLLFKPTKISAVLQKQFQDIPILKMAAMMYTIHGLYRLMIKACLKAF